MVEGVKGVEKVKGGRGWKEKEKGDREKGLEKVKGRKGRRG